MSSNPIGSNWTYPLPKTVITASQVGVPITVSLGGSFQQDVWIEASNETPYILSIFSAQGILLNQIQPQLQDIAQIPSGDNSFILVASLLLPQAAPSSEVDINVYPFGKPTGAYPIPLGRQSAPTTPATNFAFTINANFSPASGVTGAISIFNPQGSTKILTFYELATGTDVNFQCGIGYASQGSDPNLTINLVNNIFSHFDGPGAPTSVAHATGQATSTVIPFVVENGKGLAWTIRDFCQNVDQYKIAPNNGILLFLTPQGTLTTNGNFIAKYYEQ